jgi:hypothetical protein
MSDDIATKAGDETNSVIAAVYAARIAGNAATAGFDSRRVLL